VVLCCDYADSLRGDLWGIKAITNEAFDVNSPLANRFIHCWVAPSPHHKANMAFYEKAEASEFGLKLLQDGRREAQRLVYVSLTRARDMLILPMKGSVIEKGTGLPWLSNVGADWLLNSDKTLSLPNGTEIPATVVNLEAGDPVKPENQQNYFWFSAQDEEDYLPAVITPSQSKGVELEVTRSEQYGAIIPLPKDRDVAATGTGLHMVLATQLLQKQASEPELQGVCKQILSDCGLEVLMSDEVLAAGVAFEQWLRTQWPGAKWFTEYPISMTNDSGQQLNGFIDLLIETEQGWIVIDHKTTSTDISNLEHVAGHYGSQLAAYRLALESVTDKPVLAQWINFMTMGRVMECRLAG